MADLTISADGRHIAFVSMQNASNLQQVAFDPIAGRAIGVPTWLTTGSRLFHAPDIAPNGSDAAFNSLFSRQEDLFIGRPDGNEVRQLTNDRPRDRWPRWSPDGKRILFQSDRSGVWELWRMDADGSSLQQLTKHPGANGGVWSPDGKQIAFSDVTTSDVVVFDADRSWEAQEPVKLPRRPASMAGFSPNDWSPDGRQLVGNSFAGAVVVYSFDSKRYEVITDPNFSARQKWLPDSRRLLVASSGKLFVIDTASHAPTEILSVAPDEIAEVAVSRDGRRIVFARSSTAGDIWMATLK